MTYLLYSRGTRETGSYLGDALNIRHGIEPPEDREDLLIRWGSAVGVPLRPGLTLNKRVAIEQATNKFGALRCFMDAGIAVPRFIATHDLLNDEHRITAESFTRRGFRLPVLARKAIHTRGKDVLLCLQNIDFTRAIEWNKEFFVEYVPTQREYRVHVFKGRVIKVSEKVLRSRNTYVPYLRTHDNNHVFRDERTGLTEEQRAVAINAVAALELDFGAVDLLLGDDNVLYVLEVNTGPSLADTGAEAYLFKFREEIARVANR